MSTGQEPELEFLRRSLKQMGEMLAEGPQWRPVPEQPLERGWYWTENGTHHRVHPRWWDDSCELFGDVAAHWEWWSHGVVRVAGPLKPPEET